MISANTFLPVNLQPNSYSYMIDNVVLLITGTLHERDTHELLDRCHPLGVFDTMPALCVATTVSELYNTVLIETPLGKSDNRLTFQPIEHILTMMFLYSTLFCQLPQCSGFGRIEY